MEQLTTDHYVRSYDTSEWIKGMKIVLAELWLPAYRGKIPRSQELFATEAAKDRRAEYLLLRFGFMKALLNLLDLKEIALFRGMRTERDWLARNDSKFFTSWTFHRLIAESFLCLEKNSRFRHSYIVKRTFPADRIFMTYLETRAINHKYSEAEALVWTQEEDRIFF